MASAVASASNARCVPTTAIPNRLPCAVLGQPGRQLAGLERAAADVETLVDLGIRRRQRLEQPVAQHPELQVVEQPVDLVAVPRLHPQRVGRLRQRHVLDQIGELAVEHHVRQVGAQRVADLALHRVDVVDQRLQRAVLDDPLGRGLLPHARDAGQVVARDRRAAPRSRGTAAGSARTSRRPPPG